MNKAIYFLLIGFSIILVTNLIYQKAESTNTFKPYEDFHIMRNYPDYNRDASAYLKGMKKAVEQSKTPLYKNSKQQPQWIIQGPYNIDGRINTVAHNPGNDQIIYVGTVCGGIFKTTDGGENWFPIFDDQAYLSIADIVVSPHDTNTIFAATGDPNISSYPWVGNGVYKSTDAGETWQNIGITNTGIVSKLIVHPTQENTIYAATMGLPFVRDTNRGLYKTVDGGENWEKVLFLAKDAGIIDMVMIPNSPDTLIAAGWNRIRNYKESVTSGSNCKLYRTLNGGQSWDTINNIFLANSVSRIGLAVSVKDTVEIIAQYVEDGMFETKGIYKSSDFGNQWQELEANYTEDILGGFGWYFGKIRVNPFNPKQYFVLGVDLHKSDNKGNTFEFATPSWQSYEVHADKHDLTFVDSTTFLLATDGGLYKTTNNCRTWTDISNIPNTQLYRVTTDPFHNGFYCGGAQDNGTNYGNINDSANWERLFGGDGFQPIFDWQDSTIMYAETQNGGLVYRKYNDGEYSWKGCDDGIDKDDRRSWDMPVCMSQLNSKIMYTGTYRVYEKENAPEGQWQAISGDLTSGLDSKFHVISALDVSIFDDKKIIAGTSDGKVHCSDNYGWVDLSQELPDRYVTDVFLSLNNVDHFFVSHSGYKANEYVPHIHYSENSGKKWKDISGNLPQLAINSIYVLYGYGDSVIFAATDGGVYHTLDQGNYWERTGANMPVLPVYDLAYDDTNHVLVAGTFARSIMTIELSSIVKKVKKETIIDTLDAINTISVKTNLYPNPASSYFTLNCNQKLNNVSVLMHDINGKRVYKKSLNAGNQWQINVENLKNGAYFVSLINEDQIIGKQKIIINK